MEQGRIEQERLRFEESERRQRLLSDVSRLLLDYVGPDEIEPLRRIVRGVAEAVGNDWCTFALVQPDGILKNVATYHADPRQRELERKLDILVPPKPWDAPPLEVNSLAQKRPVPLVPQTEHRISGGGGDVMAYNLSRPYPPRRSVRVFPVRT